MIFRRCRAGGQEFGLGGGPGNAPAATGSGTQPPAEHGTSDRLFFTTVPSQDEGRDPFPPGSARRWPTARIRPRDGIDNDLRYRLGPIEPYCAESNLYIEST